MMVLSANKFFNEGCQSLFCFFFKLRSLNLEIIFIIFSKVYFDFLSTK